MKLVFVCHPWRGKKTNEELTKRICYELSKKEDIVPFSPALHFNQFLNDDVHEQRWSGINGGIEILKRCDAIYVYNMLGISEGMKADLVVADENNIDIVEKDLYPWERSDG